jgi:hypothetical protein
LQVVQVFSYLGTKKKLLLNNHTSAANLLPEHTLNPWLSIMGGHYS